MSRILVTGFGPFPGVKDNPSAPLMTALRTRRGHFELLGIHLETHVLPVAYHGLAARLSALAADTAPDAILHFGVATRRKIISVETRARNHANRSAPDAQGDRPPSELLDGKADKSLAVRIPAAGIAARIRAGGIAAETSCDAGAYLCNATLYETLRSRKNLPAGFIHIPFPAGPRNASQVSFDHIVAAAEIAIVALVLHVRQVNSLATSTPDNTRKSISAGVIRRAKAVA
ncbi:MAG: peptidase C15 [Methylovirgula sp.]|uniref:pyroglutamyl-peptidase I family protein n=1 Tax=Methylovirgula sp. TaxID=1978224 RepID=UPI0030762572